MGGGLLGVSLGAGMLATVNPCGFALLPAHVSLLLNAGGSAGRGRAVMRALGERPPGLAAALEGVGSCALAAISARSGLDLVVVPGRELGGLGGGVARALDREHEVVGCLLPPRGLRRGALQ